MLLFFFSLLKKKKKSYSDKSLNPILFHMHVIMGPTPLRSKFENHSIFLDDGSCGCDRFPIYVGSTEIEENLGSRNTRVRRLST
jgi:hypothetical protein